MNKNSDTYSKHVNYNKNTFFSYFIQIMIEKLGRSFYIIKKFIQNLFLTLPNEIFFSLLHFFVLFVAKLNIKHEIQFLIVRH